MGRYTDTAMQYAEDCIAGKNIVGREVVLACKRWQEDLKRGDIEYRAKTPELVCRLMENLVHTQGEDMDGNPLLGKPFKLQPWQIFVVCNLMGWYFTGTQERRYKEAFIMVGRKNGKALSLETDIPTPGGWRKMRDIHPGDYVFGKDGKPARVLVESEIFHKKMYVVKFDDGTEIEASADHLWTVQTKKSRATARRPIKGHTTWNNMRYDLRASGGWFETTTEGMSRDFGRARKDGKGTEYKYRVPIVEPVQYEEKKLPIDPYTFGVWVGDGTNNTTVITCSKEDKDEMMKNIESCGHTTKWYERKQEAGGIGVDIVHKGQKNPMREALRELGVFGNKDIPDIYLQGSIEQRLLLLQGLMDTDGHCSKAGQCEFVQKDETIARKLHELVSSLGIRANIKKKKARCNGKDAGEVWRVLFWTDQKMPAFKLERKKSRLKETLSERMNAKSIIDIQEIETEPSKCIAVDNADHLYLAGRGYTVTHNSSFISALAWAVSIVQRKSGSKCYIVASALKQTLECFHFLTWNLEYKGLRKSFDVKDNSFDHSMKYTFKGKDGTPDGSMEIIAMPTNPDAQDSFNCNFAIADEVASYKRPSQYNRFFEAQSAYTNKLMVGITTAGDNMNSFGYRRMEYAIKVVDGTVKDDSLFSLVARADQNEKGEVDFTNPEQHMKANLSYGVTKRPGDMMTRAMQALNDPQQRKDFLSRELNIYTSAMKAWFDLEEFKRSDRQYHWTLSDLAKLPIEWFGGADLSRMYDLTATALFGTYDGVDIVITHGFFPITQAQAKAEEDNIPLYGWADDGWLTMCNHPTVNISDIVNWFKAMRAMGFKIKEIGHDRKFAGEEYFPEMKRAGFRVIDQPQYYWIKSQGFRHIEKSAKDGRLYYLHSDAYEYCVSNVKAIEKTDDQVQYEKIEKTQRIDLFDASVFACVRQAESVTRRAKAKSWFGEDKKKGAEQKP